MAYVSEAIYAQCTIAIKGEDGSTAQYSKKFVMDNAEESKIDVDGCVQVLAEGHGSTYCFVTVDVHFVGFALITLIPTLGGTCPHKPPSKRTQVSLDHMIHNNATSLYGLMRRRVEGPTSDIYRERNGGGKRRRAAISRFQTFFTSVPNGHFVL
jgi:hypothetical protein